MEPIGLIVLYLLVVGYLPRIMEHRKAWDLRWLLVPYNLICVAMSAYLLVMVSLWFMYTCMYVYKGFYTH